MKILKSIGIVTIFTIIGKFLGFGRDALVAYFFGVSEITDAYFLAITIPSLLFTSMATSIASGIIPMYTKIKQNKDEKDKSFINFLGTLFLLTSILITIILFVFTPEIIQFIAPNFHSEQKELTIKLTKIMLPSFSFLVLSAFAKGILHTHKRFDIPSFSIVPNNIVIVLTIIFFANQYGIVGVTYGTLLGFIVRFLYQYPYLRKFDVTLNFDFMMHFKRAINVIVTLLPIIVASIAVQMNSLVDQMVATRLTEGSVSALNYSNRLLYLPISIVVTSLVNVFYPSIVDAFSRSKDAFITFSIKGIKGLFIVLIPISIIMFVLTNDIVSIIFERGEFTKNHTAMTAYSLFYYTPALFAIGMRDYLIRCFMAVNRNKTVMISSITVVPINILLSIYLSSIFSHGGIALATSISLSLQSIFLFILLMKSFGDKKMNVVLAFDLIKLCSVFVLTLLFALLINKNITLQSVFAAFSMKSLLVVCFSLLLSKVFKISDVVGIKKIISKKRK